MDSENEVRPLLHSFEGQSWRIRARKKCMRIPSELTITGIILGLFLVVVTLLIALENMETEKKEDISLDKNLLASPFKYNKKAEDHSWQNKKENMKMKQTRDELNQKWDNVDKGWKKFPDISGKVSNKGGWHKMLKQTIETSDLPSVVDEYGKDTEDSLEMFPSLQASDTSLMKQFNKDALEVKNLLHSGIKWKNIDDGWKALSAQGWKESRIREALFKALKEKREEIREAEGFLQSPMNLDDMWNEISESWKKNVHEGNKEIEKQKNINEGWKDKMNILQSPKSSIKKFVKADEGWQKLDEQGWKNKEIEEALVEAWKGRENPENMLQSSMNVPLNIEGLWGKLTGFFKNFVQKGSEKQKSQKEINDEWANKFGNLLQSSKMTYKKWKEIDELRKKHSKDESEDDASGKTEDEMNQPQQSSINFEDLKKIIEAIKDHQKGEMDKNKIQKEKNSEWVNEFSNILQSPRKSYKKWKKIEELRKKNSKDDWKDKSSDKTEIGNDHPQQSPINFEDLTDIIKMIKELQKDQKDKDSKKDDSEKEQPLQSPSKFDDFMEKIIEVIKDHQKDQKDKGSNKAGSENEQLLQSPSKFDDFMEMIIEVMKDHQKGNKEAEKQKGINDDWKNSMQVLSTSKQTDKKWKQVDDHWKTLIEHERNSFFGRNDNDGTASPKGDSVQYGMSLDNVKWEKIDDGYKKLTDQGWKDKDIKEAVYKAWKGGDKLLQSAMGHNNMKWKKVNDGWKTISNKS